jgi:hypothetical protein
VLSPPARIGVSACSGIVHDLRSPHINRPTAFYQQERAPQRRIQRRGNVAEILGCRRSGRLAGIDKRVVYLLLRSRGTGTGSRGR